MNAKKYIQKTLMLIVLLSLPQTFLFANNIQISNVSITGQNTASKYKMIQFDISWENSWRTSTEQSNWDAAWIFIKYRSKLEKNGTMHISIMKVTQLLQALKLLRA